MTGPSWRILCVDATLPPRAAPDFVAIASSDPEPTVEQRHGDPAIDAVLLDGDRPEHRDIDIAALFAGAAWIVVLRDADDAAASLWVQRGADDVLSQDELAAFGAATARRLRFAIERRRRDRERLLAYSTDPGTGLPHRQQLVEHLSQLLALREREPSPMAVVVLRVEGLLADDGSGNNSGNSSGIEPLRRKLAVRLRAGVRASDVVAAVDGQSFAVLLGAILAPGDAERVAEKLAQSLMLPFQIGGGECEVAVAVGIGRYPQDGKDAERLLRRAVALAAVAPASGRTGPATVVDAAGSARVAANDDGA